MRLNSLVLTFNCRIKTNIHHSSIQNSINNCLYVLNSAVKNIFNEKEDINIIFDNDSLVGYATLPRRNSRSYRFLEALDGFEESEDDEIYERLGDISDTFKDFERYKDESWWFSEEEKEELQIQTATDVKTENNIENK